MLFCDKQVKTTKPSRFLGETNYGVELIVVPDDASEPDVYISHMLIAEKLAIERRLDVLVRVVYTCYSREYYLLN